MSSPAGPGSLAAERQARVFALLACPQCLDGLEVEQAVVGDGYVYDADLTCGACGLVGVVTTGRPTFHAHDLTRPEVPRGLVVVELTGGLGALARSGDWLEVSEGLLAQHAGAALTGELYGVGLVVEILKHAWSGRGVLKAGGRSLAFDAYASEPERLVLVLDGLTDGQHRWSLTAVEGGNPDRSGDQLVVRQVRELVPAARALVPAVFPVNRGNPYPARFEEVLQEQAADALVLDLGGGDRRHADRRVLNLEYLPYEAVDLHGDGLRLPMASCSVDLILSQAVLEHVPDPALAVSEMHRVLRPGGLVYCEIAFMQPLHAVPYHFFNVTPHGAAHLFEDFEVLSDGVFGGLAGTMSWFFRLLDAEQRLGKHAAEGVLAALSDLDATLTARELAHVASAVFVEARKRVE